MRKIGLFVFAIIASSIIVVPIKNVSSTSAEDPYVNSFPLIIAPANQTRISNHVVTFGWYHVEDAREYFLQVDDDIDFKSPEIEIHTKNVVFTSRSLLDGTYYWRVKAYKINNEALWLWKGIAQFEIFSAVGITAVQDLGVPHLQQHKDTRMLCLDWDIPGQDGSVGGCLQTGEHAWDMDHGRRGCLHDDWYCARASIAMINRYYGGSLSQDEISYYQFHGGPPEGDLGHGWGMWPDGALSWALGGVKITQNIGKPAFKDITDQIDRKIPVLVIQQNPDGSTHAVVVDGYETDGVNWVHVIDPWTGNELSVDYSTWNVHSVYWIASGALGLPSDPDVSFDSDGDGIVDFDEINRFGTNPNKADSDGDGSPDKSEIAYYTFTTHNPDPNGNGVRMELDPNEKPPRQGVGGIVLPVDKFALLAPYIGLTSTIVVASVVSVVYVKRVKRRKEKQ